MALSPYPSDVTSDVVRMVVDAARGNIPTTQDACLAAWNLLGYGLSQIVGAPEAAAPVAAVALSLDAGLDALSRYATSLEGGVALAPAVPWPLLLPILKQVLDMLLDQWLK